MQGGEHDTQSGKVLKGSDAPRQLNEMNNQNSSKMRRISVCLYWTLISHYWPLLIIIQ